MNSFIPKQSLNEELHNANAIVNNFHIGMTHSTSALFAPFKVPDVYSNYLSNPQKYQDWKKIIQEKNEDLKYVSNYVIQGKSSCETVGGTDAHMKIFHTKNLLSEVIFLKKQLKNIRNETSNVDKRFEMKLNMANEIKKEILKRLAEFDELTIKKMQRSLNQRAKKRKGICTRKRKLFDFKKDAEKKILEKHQAIDKLLGEKAKEVDVIKKEENLKRQADSVLHEVRQKKLEAKKILSTLNALSKLRQVRSEEELAKGGYCSKPLTDTFNDAISHFREMWTRQLEHYQLEEKGLKVMLEGNAAPEFSWTKSKHQAALYQWEQAIFGDAMSCSGKVYIQSENGLESLIDIRRKWDRYLVTTPTVMTSSIPVGWVLPSKTEDENWLKFVRKKKLVVL